ncbi:MAG TPA: branched-chain amino acid ABC transporter substrate-binding protein [Longimicrobiaceae bacterium]|nr:branched-chain amino acid ABC transporter substrate-binding protein [Longimicrobiaceae bacterium]
MTPIHRPIRRRIALSLALLALAGCGQASEEPIRIGLAGPLGQANGRSMKLAAQMAVDEINAAGGVRGRKLELVEKDDEASPDRAIAVAGFLRDSTDVVAVIGHVNSGATIAAAKIYNEEEGEHGGAPLTQISPASSSPQVTDAGRWTFRVCPSDLLHGPAVATHAFSRLGSRRAAVLYTNDAYGRGVAETFTEAFRKAGGAVVARDPYLPALVEDPSAVDPYLVRALRSGMDALMIAGQADAGMRIVRQARRLGYTGPVVGADGMTGVKDAGADAEGIYVSSAFLPDRSSDRAQAFVKTYRERFDELPDHRGAMAYDAIKLLAEAIERAGTDRRKLRDEVEKVGLSGSGVAAYEGVSGTIAFDENGDVPGKEVAVGMVRGGQLTTVR